MSDGIIELQIGLIALILPLIYILYISIRPFMTRNNTTGKIEFSFQMTKSDLSKDTIRNVFRIIFIALCYVMYAVVIIVSTVMSL